MIITLAGLPGAGKSTIKKLLADQLHLKTYSVGDFRGRMALERGLTIDELNALGLDDASTDTLADDFQKKLGQTEDDFVIDGRLSWYFIPQSFKTFLTVDPDEGARRIFEARKNRPETRADEPAYATQDDAKQAIAVRIASDVARYQKWYGLDFVNPAQYDLVIDTTHKTPEEIVDEITANLPRT